MNQLQEDDDKHPVTLTYSEYQIYQCHEIKKKYTNNSETFITKSRGLKFLDFEFSG